MFAVGMMACPPSRGDDMGEESAGPGDAAETGRGEGNGAGDDRPVAGNGGGEEEICEGGVDGEGIEACVGPGAPAGLSCRSVRSPKWLCNWPAAPVSWTCTSLPCWMLFVLPAQQL